MSTAGRTWEAIVPSGEFYHLQRDRLHYSPAVRAGQLLICSGVVGAEASGKLVPEPGAQIERAFENLAWTPARASERWRSC